MALSLTKELPRDYAPPINFSHIQVKASTTIWAGQVVATDTANHVDLAVPWDVAGTFTTPRFLGFASNTVVQTATSTDRVRLITQGRVKLTAAQLGGESPVQDQTVYASNDGTFTLTAGSNLAIGKVKQLVEAIEYIVAFEALAMRSL